MSIEINVKLFANLRSFHKDANPIRCSEAHTIRDVLQSLRIPEKKVSIILVNGKHAALEDELESGDTVALFPPLGGG